MIMPGLINLDFADIKSIMEIQRQKRLWELAEPKAKTVPSKRAEQAPSNPLLDDRELQ